MKYPADGTAFELDSETVTLLYNAVAGRPLSPAQRRAATVAVDYVSAATLIVETEEEEEEPPVYDDNDMENPYPRDREDGEGTGPLPGYGD